MTDDIPEVGEEWFAKATLKRKRGRPRKYPLPPVPPRPVLVLIADRRHNPRREPGSGGSHANVPGDWTARMILERYGIAEHLHVVVADPDGHQRVIQHGRTCP